MEKRGLQPSSRIPIFIDIYGIVEPDRIFKCRSRIRMQHAWKPGIGNLLE